MEGPFPIDLWLSAIAPHLDVRSLCALMACSRRSFCLWSSEPAWQHQRARICAVHPELAALFEQYGCKTDREAAQRLNEQAVERNNPSKRRKTPWLMPTRGTWFVFNRFLSLGCDMRGFKELCRHVTREACDDINATALIKAIVRTHVPHGERFLVINIEHYDAPYQCMYMVRLYTSARFSSRLEMKVFRRDDAPRFIFWHDQGDGYAMMSASHLYEVDGCDNEPNWWFDAWQYLLLGLPFNPYWTPEFEARMAAH